MIIHNFTVLTCKGQHSSINVTLYSVLDFTILQQLGKHSPTIVIHFMIKISAFHIQFDIIYETYFNSYKWTALTVQQDKIFVLSST